MNKTLKSILLIVLVVAVLAVASFATGKKSVETITLEEYNSISSSDGFVYYGKSENMNLVKDIAKNYDLRISFLDSKENKNKDLKEGTLYEYKDGKEVYKYNGNFESFMFFNQKMAHFN